MTTLKLAFAAAILTTTGMARAASYDLGALQQRAEEGRAAAFVATPRPTTAATGVSDLGELQRRGEEGRASPEDTSVSSTQVAELNPQLGELQQRAEIGHDVGPWREGSGSADERGSVLTIGRHASAMR